MKKILHFCLITFYATTFLSCGKSPAITVFELLSNPITATALVEFNLSTEDDSEITGWLVKDSATKPLAKDPEWTSAKPSEYTLTGALGEKILYAWVKKGSSISDSASLIVNWVVSGTEDTLFWDKKIDGNGDSDSANAIAIDSDNNVYVAGYGTNLISVSSGSDWWIKKFDKNGNEDTENWNKMFDGNAGNDGSLSITIDSDNSVYVAGYGENIVGPATGYDWWIKKFDSDGNEDTYDWNKKADFTDIDYAKSVFTDSNKNVYAGGYVNNYKNVTSGTDLMIRKFAGDGTEDTLGWSLATKSYDGNGGGDRINAVGVDSNNNIYAVGWGNAIAPSSTAYDWWIKQFNAAGTDDTANWDKKIDGGLNSGYDAAFAIAFDSQNNAYIMGQGEKLVSGTSGLDFWLKKFGSNGTEITASWDKKIDGGASTSDYGRAIAIHKSSGTVFVCGFGNNLVEGASGEDWWMKRFSTDGSEDPSWEKIFDGNGSADGCLGLTVDSDGNLYAVGYGLNIVGDTSNGDMWIKKFIFN